jgi:hypothetical protein
MAITEQNFTANDNKPRDNGVQVDGQVYNGKIVVWAEGRFGGGTLSLQFKPEGASNWSTWSATNLTADGQFTAELTGQCNIRLSLSGATAPNLNAGVL